ncbi:hypothetical protein TNCV_2251801 [Trichonephila clavipes]|nr:hypothetical protein TNCV_2251801 [Trichonephila clavipes]
MLTKWSYNTQAFQDEDHLPCAAAPAATFAGVPPHSKFRAAGPKTPALPSSVRGHRSSFLLNLEVRLPSKPLSRVFEEKGEKADAENDV